MECKQKYKYKYKHKYKCKYKYKYHIASILSFSWQWPQAKVPISIFIVHLNSGYFDHYYYNEYFYCWLPWNFYPYYASTQGIFFYWSNVECFFFLLRCHHPVVALEVLDVMIWALIKAPLCLDEDISPHHCHIFLCKRFSSSLALYCIVLPCAACVWKWWKCRWRRICLHGRDALKVKYLRISLCWLLDSFFGPNLTKVAHLRASKAVPKIHSRHFHRPWLVGLPRDTLGNNSAHQPAIVSSDIDLSASLSSNGHSGKDFSAHRHILQSSITPHYQHSLSLQAISR